MICIAALLLVALPAVAGDTWPEFRGPTGDGQTDATKLPLTWNESKNIAWKTLLAGRAWSSPVIQGKQIWLTDAPKDGETLSAVCIDRDSGKIVHDIKVFDVDKPMKLNPLNSHASPTPVVEAGRVWVHFGSYGTACLDTETGKTIWSRRDIKCDHEVGPGSSPVISGERLILTFDGIDVRFVTALDKTTGKTLWKTSRRIDLSGVSTVMRKAFATPTVIDVGGKKLVVSDGAGAAFAYDVESGKEVWKVRYDRGFSTAMRPIYAGGMIFVNSGFSKPRLMAVRPDGRGDVTRSHVAYTLTADMPIKSSPAAVDGLMYFVSDRGVMSCSDVKTGKRLWREKVGGAFSASPIVAPGRIYFFDHEGTCIVIRPGRKFEKLATNKLEDGCMASPAVVGDALYVRTRSALYRIENRK